MSEIIENIYTFKSEQGIDSYVYSLKKSDDHLGYDYYFLTKDENDNQIIYEAINPLIFLQNNKLNIIPIKKNTSEYEKFLKELENAMNIKNKEVLNRR